MKGKLREGGELRGEIMEIAEVKIMFMAKKYAPIVNEVNDVETFFFVEIFTMT